MIFVVDSIIRMFSGVGQCLHIGTIQNDMDKSDESQRVESIQPFFDIWSRAKSTHI